MRIFGNTTGLKANQLRQLDKLYRRRVPPDYVITPELARDMSVLSHGMKRQIGLLINRQGKISHVIVGTHHRIFLPNLDAYRAAPGRLRGIRCVHTHLGRSSLDRDDLTDLSLLRLDLMAAITQSPDTGYPEKIHVGHILPGDTDTPCTLMPPLSPSQLDIDCREMILALETELAQHRRSLEAADGVERALLVSVTTAPKRVARSRLSELRELALSSGIAVVDTVLQVRKSIDPRYLMGLGKLQDLTIQAMQTGATLLVFDQELNPAQIRSIADAIEMKVIDRTQLILDIFAQRANSREGKLQVELAQLKYLLPRLVTRNTAMSRLTGGIGGRGPGETKLEINRRRARDRIRRLEKQLDKLRGQRHQQKARRQKNRLPVISIIGYTNAGKSTLLNTMTQSDVLVENRLFATLDPTSRRLRFPQDLDVIITDTVGFIRDLPKELMAAFGATLEELQGADVLLHVIDASNPRCDQQIRSVDRILGRLELDRIPCIRVLNKTDRVADEDMAAMSRRFRGVPVCAIDRPTLRPLIVRLVEMITALPTR